MSTGYRAIGAGAGRGGRGEAGIALLTVLWILLLLSAMAASLVAISRTEANVVRNAVDSARAANLADAAVHRTIFDLLAAPPGDRPRTDGTAARFDFGEAEIWVSIQDANGLVDINQGDDALLRAVLVELGVEESSAGQLVDRIADFRDPDDLVRLEGAERRDYEAQGLPWQPKDAPFVAIEELQQVLGMTPEIYRRLSPFVTVHSQRRAVDPATAPETVLRAAPDLDRAGVDAILDRRARSDDGADPAAARPTTQRRAGSGSAPGVYTIRATAILADRATFVREATVQYSRSDQRPYRILRWQQSLDRRPSDTGDVAE